MIKETNAFMPINVSMRVYYSSYHLWAAKEFSENALSIENNHTGKPKFDIKHRALISNSILSSVAFIEAAINEIFKDASDGHLSYIEMMPQNKIQLISGYWNETEAKNKYISTLNKYQLVLEFCGIEKFDKSNSIYQNASMAIRLRNSLIHYKPESLSVNDNHKLSSQLIGKFPKNKLMETSGNPFFPDHCLGYGSAKWACNAVESFADTFFEKIEVKPNYQRVHFNVDT